MTPGKFTTGPTLKTRWPTKIRFDEFKKKTQLGSRDAKVERVVMSKGRGWYVRNTSHETQRIKNPIFKHGSGAV